MPTGKREQVQQAVLEPNVDAIVGIAGEGSNLGIEIVDVAGHVEEVSTRVKTQASKFHSLHDSALEVLGCDRAMGEAAEAVGLLARTTGEEVSAKQAIVQEALAGIRALVGDVQTTAARLEELRASLEEAARTAGSIAEIAHHTHILAINATVEATHAGQYGAGFSVIAREVRELANRARDTSRSVDTSLKALATVAGQLAEASQQGKRKAESVGEGARSIAVLVELVAKASQDIGSRTESIVKGSSDVERRVSSFIEDVKELDAGVEASSASLGVVNERLNGLMGLTERILGMSAEASADTPDRPYVNLALGIGEKVAQLLEAEIASGRTTVDALFDESYVPVPRTDPQQFMAQFTAITDQLLPPLIEPPLQDPKVVFVVAVDRNGYLPTHNHKFSHPQGADPKWNTANCRNRRMFDDRVGLSAARNTRPFLIQCYRRDMGGGNFALMKDASAPIIVAGRHWGALRVGYRT